MTSKPAGAWAREFVDPGHAATWRVRLVRPSPAGELSLWGGRVAAPALRFENGVETRELQPAPPDWRECDDAALWHYCQAARLCGIRRALAGGNQTLPKRTNQEKPASPVLLHEEDERPIAGTNPWRAEQGSAA